MALTLILAKKIASLAIIIFLGFLIVRLKVLSFEDSKALSTFALYVLTPCAMLGAFQYPFSPEKLSGMGLSLLGGFLAAAVFACLSFLLKRLFRWGPVELRSVEYPNVGNFMIPLIASVMGGEGLIYLCPVFIIMNVSVFTHCQATLSGSNRFHISMITKNIVLFATFLGFVFFLLDWQLPGILGDTVRSLGDMMGPVYMFTVGMILGSADLKSVFSNKKAYLLCLLRLVVYPLAAMLLLCLTGMYRLHPEGKEILTVVVLAAGAPAAVMVTQFTQLYRSEEEAQFASSVNIMSTILCLLTLPALSWLYQEIAYKILK